MANKYSSGDNIVTDTQLEFVKWVYETYSYDLNRLEYRIVEMVATQTEETRNMGYMTGSRFQDILNQVRSKFLKIYNESKKL